jgi:hypothetical protein
MYQRQAQNTSQLYGCKLTALFGGSAASMRPVALRQWITPLLRLSVSCIILMNYDLMLSASQARKTLFFSHLDVLIQGQTMIEALILRNGLAVA